MLAICAAFAFLIALVLDLAHGSIGRIGPTDFMLAGLVLLALSVVAPGWPRTWPRRTQ